MRLPSITTTLPQFGQFLGGTCFAEGKATKLSSVWSGRHEEVLKVPLLRTVVVILGRCWNNIWRREWDSNPRYSRPYTGFRDRRFRPLSHLSVSSQIIPVDRSFQVLGRLNAELFTGFLRGRRGRHPNKIQTVTGLDPAYGGQFIYNTGRILTHGQRDWGCHGVRIRL